MNTFSTYKNIKTDFSVPHKNSAEKKIEDAVYKSTIYFSGTAHASLRVILLNIPPYK